MGPPAGGPALTGAVAHGCCHGLWNRPWGRSIRSIVSENRVSAGERYAAVYEITLSRCIFCGFCEVACPFDAITMGHDYEMSDYTRSDLIFTKEMLLADAIERTPLRQEGE